MCGRWRAGEPTVRRSARWTSAKAETRMPPRFKAPNTSATSTARRPLTCRSSISPFKEQRAFAGDFPFLLGVDHENSRPQKLQLFGDAIPQRLTIFSDAPGEDQRVQ